MRASEPASDNDWTKPLWQAGLVNLIVQATAALVPAMAIREAMIAHLHEGLKPWEGLLSRPEMWTPAWFAELLVAYGWAFVAVLPGVLLFVAIARWLERHERATTLEWAIAGTIAQVPLAIGLCVFVGTNMHGPVDTSLLLFLVFMVAPVPCAIGLGAGLFAWHFRHHRRHDWSDPL